MRKALMLASGFRLQYRALRCAAPLFDEIQVYGTSTAKPLRYSSFCGRFHVTHSPEKIETDADLEAINRICDEEDIECVLPSDAITTRFVAVNKHRLKAQSYPVPSPELFDELDDKGRFAELCTRLNIPHPPTRIFSTFEEVKSFVLSCDRKRSFVAKPLAMWGSFGVEKIDADTIENNPRPLSYSPILLQDYIPGYDITTAVLSRNGTLEKAVHYRRKDGEVEFFDHPEASECAARIAASSSCNGVLVFDIRVTPDGDIFFIECNPRFWYRMEVAMLAGANFVEFGLWPQRSNEAPFSPLRNISLPGPLALLRRLRHPWKLTKSDVLRARYYFSDPLPNIMMLGRLFGSAGRAAAGRQL